MLTTIKTKYQYFFIPCRNRQKIYSKANMEIQGKGKTIMKNNMQCGHTIPDFKNYYQPIEIKKK